MASGWLVDRVGRKIPLMISILGYSACNFIAGFSPTLLFLLIFRALLRIFMGAAGAALAMVAALLTAVLVSMISADKSGNEPSVKKFGPSGAFRMPTS